MADSSKVNEIKSVLMGLQAFDVRTLGRRDALGEKLNFDVIVPEAHDVVEFFKKLPVEVLDEIPDSLLEPILSVANLTRKLFDDVSAFDAAQPDPNGVRSGLLDRSGQLYGRVFDKLYPWISYGVARTVDFNGLDSEARAAVRSIQDRQIDFQKLIDERFKRVDELEQKLRSALTEQGVTQQAKYFSEEADMHAKAANNWQKYTNRWLFAVVGVAFLSFFTHRIPWIAPTNVAEAIQFIASKVLLIGALTFMLVRSARNYRAHKHNEVVNRHKQNALLTFNALVEAGASVEARNTVLNHAASSIYAQPDSGYVTTAADRGASNTTLIDMLPRASGQLANAG